MPNTCLRGGLLLGEAATAANLAAFESSWPILSAMVAHLSLLASTWRFVDAGIEKWFDPSSVN